MWPRRRQPPIVSFLIAGVQKGGTSSVDAYLREHPQVCMAHKKEVHFFDFDDRTEKYKWYHRYFEPTAQHRAVGEATPIYTYCPESMRRIWEYNPAMRLVVLFRNPIERAWSHWRMEAAAQRDTMAFADAIRLDVQRCRELLPSHHRVYSYVDRGFYSEQIRRIRRFFPDDQVLLIKSESFFANPQPRMDEVCKFVGVDPFVFSTEKAHRVGQDMGQVPPDDRQFLIETYRHDVAEVQRLLGWDCCDWLK
jgi:hypothetical protein